ncbi:cytochrome-c peroxidase [Photobacterium sp. 1_MG-2023]|uniref:cytochrome-c peroxidase n=1 Tax=Photobacterium sp. 1_MG-2023 TaxID=3062646 RepID=UPI0026E243F0|nr:cytochrome c peroxidase [Photobacterium sp. 1_MG-2023]MDO6707280.1 cytochrome c peroxidase [Photobacterium sp. 1_MG-2023]
MKYSHVFLLALALTMLGGCNNDDDPVAGSDTPPSSNPGDPVGDDPGNPPPGGEEPTPDPDPEPDPEPVPEPRVDIDGLPLPDTETSPDYESYVAGQPEYYTSISSTDFQNIRFRSVATEDNTPRDNELRNPVAKLGRILFYDVRLSANNTKSCASCHQQEHGFTDPAQLSVGFEGGHTGRNSMGLSNARYYDPGRFFWDERAATLEDQTLMPIQDPVEMGMNLFDLETKLGLTSFYGQLFTDAFGDEAITSQRMALAMAQFMRSMVSYESKFDLAVQAELNNDPNPVLSAQEQRGLVLFEDLNCTNCHTTMAFVMDRNHNNGSVSNNNPDQGVGGNLAGFFKTGSLRNIAVGAPFFHDGHLPDLMSVIEFYNSGVNNHNNLSPDLRDRTGRPVRMNLTQADKEALVAFLETLTDEGFLSNPIFSDPFPATTPDESEAGEAAP